jgi:hypothetical protein
MNPVGYADSFKEGTAAGRLGLVFETPDRGSGHRVSRGRGPATQEFKKARVQVLGSHLPNLGQAITEACAEVAALLPEGCPARTLGRILRIAPSGRHNRGVGVIEVTGMHDEQNAAHGPGPR